MEVVVGVAGVYLYEQGEASLEEQLIVLLRREANVDIVVVQEQVAEFTN
jgi:vacuolar-type H+-ATPase subunit F/Vma7